MFSFERKNTALRLLAVILAVIMLIPSLAACTQSQPITESKITEATVTKDGDKISIKAQFTEKTLSALPKNAKLHLLEYTSDMDVASDAADAEDLGEAKAKENVSFEVALDDGVRTRRYSSFVIASYDEEKDTYTPLTPLAAIRFEAAEAKEQKDDKPEISIKGLATDSAAMALKLGAAHALVEVRLERLLIDAWQDDAVPYVYDGVTYYLRGSELSRIDGLVKTYSDNGVRVYLRFVLKDVGEELENTVGGLAFPSAEDAKSYLVNMDNPSTARRMEGALDFLACRYSETAEEDNGFCNRFVIGQNVNNTEKYASCGGLDKARVMSVYEKLVRIANTALVTYNEIGYAYISVDSAWRTGSWKGEEFVASFATEAAARGDYAWQVSCGLYASTPEVWEDKTDDYLTPDMLSSVSDLLALRKYKFNETDVRGILIHDFDIPGDSSENQAASYAYAYYRAMEAGVEALIYSTLRDGDETERGILSNSSDSIVGNKPLCEVFKTVDTDNCGEAVKFAEQKIGLRFSQVASALGDNAHPVVRVDGAAGVGGETKDTPILYSFDGDMHGFTPTANVKYSEFEYSEAFGAAYLNMALENNGRSGGDGVYVTLTGADILKAEEMIITLYAGDPTSADKNSTVTLNIVRPSKGIAAEEKGTVIYTATATGVSGSAWQNVSFDVSDFCEKIDGEDELILCLTASTPNTDEGFFGIKDIYIEGVNGDLGVLGVILIIVVILVLLGIVGALVYFVLKRKNGRGSHPSEE